MALSNVLLAFFILNLISIPLTIAQASRNICGTVSGTFPVQDGTCKRFRICFDNVGVTYECPGLSLFDETNLTCSADYVCTQTQACITGGRFPVDDTDCRRYYLCFWENNGYVMWELSCPNQLIFNPQTQRCVPSQNYTCPVGGNGGIVLG